MLFDSLNTKLICNVFDEYVKRKIANYQFRHLACDATEDLFFNKLKVDPRWPGAQTPSELPNISTLFPLTTTPHKKSTSHFCCCWDCALFY